MEIKIEPSWKKELENEFKQEYFQLLAQHIKVEKSQGKKIYPPGSLIFNAFEKTPFNNVKVVILGQDPYHGAGQAHGLSFSVPQGVPPPPSLINIFKELYDDVGVTIPNHGDLTNWALQGVLLLNASLTVRNGEPMSHSKIGWATFTNKVIETVANQKKNVVFILWGKFAQEKSYLIKGDHCILKAPHPSPLSAHTGFIGSKPFSKTNDYLTAHNINPIDWKL